MAVAEREVGVSAPQAEVFTEEDFVPLPYRWTREQFNEIGDMGLFEGRRAILVEGVILAMPAMKKPQRTALVLADEAFRAAFGPGYFMSMQSPFGIGKATDPEPDIVVVIGTMREFLHRGVANAALVVEVSDSTIAYDRSKKSSLYAKAGVADYWIINLDQKPPQVEVYRHPQPDETQHYKFGYSERTVHQSGEILLPLASPNPVAVAALLP